MKSVHYKITRFVPRGLKTNSTTAYSFNAYDKLSQVTMPDSSVVSFLYGADGLRRQKTDVGGTRNYLLDGLAVLAEYTNQDTVLTSYIPGVSVTTGGNTYYYHNDRLGSTKFMTDSNGNIVQQYSYDAWGNTSTETGILSQPYQFVGVQGYYSDAALDLQLLGQRWYDPTVGRFISRDPIGFKGEINLYSYADNNPINDFDPTGTVSISIPGLDGCMKMYGNKGKIGESGLQCLSDCLKNSSDPISFAKCFAKCIGKGVPANIGCCVLFANSNNRNGTLPNLDTQDVCDVDYCSCLLTSGVGSFGVEKCRCTYHSCLTNYALTGR